MPHILKRAARLAASRLAPNFVYCFRMERLLRSRNAEAELALLPKYCRRNSLSVDIGANEGLYTYVMSLYSESVVAFEPNPVLAASLSASLRGRATVWQCALSDRRGEALLRYPASAMGQATIEPGNCLGRGADDDVVQVRVETRLLDDLDLRGVAVIKIDVEGHEDAAIRGAARTIRREKPLLIVEVEERHKPGAMRVVRQLMENIGYRGWFLEDDEFFSIDVFVPELHQILSNLSPDGRYRLGRYVNNFVFLPHDAPPPSAPRAEDRAELNVCASFAARLARTLPAP